MTRVVLVRPWRAARASGGCCSAAAADVCLDHEPAATSVARAYVDPLASTYRRLRTVIPATDVQVVSASNCAYLLPWAYRAGRVRLGRLDALREAIRATTAGAVLVDGRVVGDVDALGAEGILRCLGRRSPGTAQQPMDEGN